MTDVEIWALQQFSATGSDVRMAYTTVGTDTKLQYIGVCPSIDAPTSGAHWYMGKLYYNGDGCMTRFVKFSTQKIWDDRGTLFPA